MVQIASRREERQHDLGSLNLYILAEYSGGTIELRKLRPSQKKITCGAGGRCFEAAELTETLRLADQLEHTEVN